MQPKTPFSPRIITGAYQMLKNLRRLLKEDAIVLQLTQWYFPILATMALVFGHHRSLSNMTIILGMSCFIKVQLSGGSKHTIKATFAWFMAEINHFNE